MDATEGLPNLGDVIDVVIPVAIQEVEEDYLPGDGAPSEEVKGQKLDASPTGGLLDTEKGMQETDIAGTEPPTTAASTKLSGQKCETYADTTIEHASPNTTSTATAPIADGIVTKKRVRRVGKMTFPKSAKLEVGETPGIKIERDEPESANAGDEMAKCIDSLEEAPPAVLTKHDEKWSERFDKLLEYKANHGHTMVPQCYPDDPRLGRWVHYQRVEYWLFHQTGDAKITQDRINRLDAIGFEWDPQKAQWDMMFEKLKKFKADVGHCRVPKGYSKDPELANWVRNQRLEHANQRKGKKSRMTPERFELLSNLEFRWSASTPSRSKNKNKKGIEEQPQEVVNEEVGNCDIPAPLEQVKALKNQGEESPPAALKVEAEESTDVTLEASLPVEL